MNARYEELKTPEAVLAAHAAGRTVEFWSPDRRSWEVACFPKRARHNMETREFRYRALIEEPAITDDAFAKAAADAISHPSGMGVVRVSADGADHVPVDDVLHTAIPAGYKPWGGGECPEDAKGGYPELIFRNGKRRKSYVFAEAWRWSNTGHDYDIIAYRVESEQAKSRTISDEIMDVVDRLGSEADAVDPRCWEHLRAYMPKDAQPSQQGEAVARVCLPLHVGAQVMHVIVPDGGRLPAWGVDLYTQPLPTPVESLGRDAEGVEGLALEGLDYFERAGDAGDRKYVQAIRELLARRLRPAVDEAMVEPSTRLYKDVPSRLRAFALIIESDGVQLLFRDNTYVGAGWRIVDMDYVKRLDLYHVSVGHYDVCVNGTALTAALTEGDR